MEGKAAAGGSFGPGTTDMTLQQAVFAGLVDPGKIEMRRSIVTEPTTAGTIDTAVFSGPRGELHDHAPIADGVFTVVDNVGADGIDTLTGIENLRFTDGDFTVAPSATLTAPTSCGRSAISRSGRRVRPGRSRSRTAASAR